MLSSKGLGVGMIASPEVLPSVACLSECDHEEALGYQQLYAMAKKNLWRIGK